MVKIEVKKEVNVINKVATEQNYKMLLDEDKVECCIDAMVTWCNKRREASKKKFLFNGVPDPVLLQIQAIKIPETERQLLRIVLPHPLVRNGADVCLITRDVKFATKTEVERSVQHFQKYLEEKKVKGITQIIPRRQLINEMKPHEAKGRFARLYDAYLVDGELLGLVSSIVGRRFYRCNKNLIPVNMKAKDLQKEISRALSKTVLTLSGKGDTFSIPVADTGFTAQQIKENVLTVVQALASGMFPGGFPNIRGLRIKTSRSIAIPIYLSLAPSDSVETPVVKPKRPRAAVPFTDELSTQIGGRVTVYPDGEVDFERSFTAEDAEMGFTDAKEEEEEEEEEEFKEEVKEEPEAVKQEADHDDSDSEDDVEAAEAAYLSEIQQTQTQEPPAKAKAAEAKTKKKPKKSEQKTLTGKENVSSKSKAKPVKSDVPQEAKSINKREKKVGTVVKAKAVKETNEPQTPEVAKKRLSITVAEQLIASVSKKKSATKVNAPGKGEQVVETKVGQKAKGKKDSLKTVAEKLQVVPTKKKSANQSSSEPANTSTPGADQTGAGTQGKASKKIKKLKSSNKKLQQKLENKKLARKEKLVVAKKAKKAEVAASSVVQDVEETKKTVKKQATPAENIEVKKRKSKRAAVEGQQGITDKLSKSGPLQTEENTGAVNGKSDKRKLVDSEKSTKKLKPSSSKKNVMPVVPDENQSKVKKEKPKTSSKLKKIESNEDVLEKVSKKKSKAASVNQIPKDVKKTKKK